MRWFFGTPWKVKRELDKNLGGKKSSEYKATLEFLEELNPRFFSFKNLLGDFGVVSSTLSVLPVVGGLFETPDAYSKLNKNVDLSVVFSSKIIPSNKDAQKKLDSLKLDKKDRNITLDQYVDLNRVVIERGLKGDSLRKVKVTSHEIRDKDNKEINLNPASNDKIKAHHLHGTSKHTVDKVVGVVSKFSPSNQKELLGRFDFSKTYLDAKSFTELKKLAESHGLDVFEDLKVKPENIKTRKINDKDLQDRIVTAARSKKPLDLNAVDISDCDLEYAFHRAHAELAKDGKSLKGLRINTSEFEGTTMNRFQKQVFDKLLTERTPSQPPIDTKRSGVSNTVTDFIVEKVQSAFASIVNVIGGTMSASELVRTRQSQVEQVAGVAQR